MLAEGGLKRKKKVGDHPKNKKSEKVSERRSRRRRKLNKQLDAIFEVLSGLSQQKQISNVDKQR
jgi:hypothetical protein